MLFGPGDNQKSNIPFTRGKTALSKTHNIWVCCLSVLRTVGSDQLYAYAT